MSDDFFTVLLDDLMEEARVAVKAASQIQRRSVVRSGFAAIEGCIRYIKDTILDDLHLNPGLHTLAEVAMLREEAYGVDRHGDILIQPKFIPTDANLQFTLKMWCRGTSDGKLDLAGQGWQSFKSSLKLRNRLAHPKQVSDLTVTDAEMRVFIECLCWFLKTIQEKFAEVLEIARVERSNKGTDSA